ncbi:uncharacterized protein LOC135166892 isoform X2 [Diachasmimorpha longicaudata]|uniref:uncharacterized protein LOC135166892 isoform X2 n=1 Tax=Diachasmimorpha longicaudata TaxID=58733 RepID=UPI0030B91006
MVQWVSTDPIVSEFSQGVWGTPRAVCKSPPEDFPEKNKLFPFSDADTSNGRLVGFKIQMRSHQEIKSSRTPPHPRDNSKIH